MNLEKLTNHQIILLTMLVAFVSAVFSAITTVTLMEQTPPALTQTINKVVERTVERVVPVEVEGEVKETVIEKETTVVVKEEDLITDSIEKNKKKIVRLVNILTTETPNGTSTPIVEKEYVFHGIGVHATADGVIVTAASMADIDELYAVTNSGAEYLVEVVNVSDSVAVLRLVPQREDETFSFSPAVFANGASMKLGQSVLALGGEERTSVSMGIIASLVNGEVVVGENTRQVVATIQTNIANSIPGSPLVNIFGEIVGIDLLGTPGVFTASDVIKVHLNASLAESAASTETTEAQSETQEG